MDILEQNKALEELGINDSNRMDFVLISLLEFAPVELIAEWDREKGNTDYRNIVDRLTQQGRCIQKEVFDHRDFIFGLDYETRSMLLSKITLSVNDLITMYSRLSVILDGTNTVALFRYGLLSSQIKNIINVVTAALQYKNKELGIDDIRNIQFPGIELLDAHKRCQVFGNDATYVKEFVERMAYKGIGI